MVEEVVFIPAARACSSSHRLAPTLQTQGGCCAANIKDQRRAKPGDRAAGSGPSEGSPEGRQSSERSSNRLASSGKGDSSEARQAIHVWLRLIADQDKQWRRNHMGQKQAGRFCVHCQKNIMATGTTPNHLLHLFLGLITFGLWIPIWILVTLGKIGGYRCTQCGSRV